MRTILFIFFIGISQILIGQEKITNSFSFQNGLYLSFEEFKNNKPSMSWNEVTSDLIIMEKVHRSKITNLKDLNNNLISLEKIWGFTVNGIPYKNVGSESEQGMFVFSGIQLRGRICFYEYKETVDKPVTIKAFNPKTGKPFRQAKLSKKENRTIAKIMNFDTGNSKLYTRDNVARFISDDKQLFNTFRNTPMKELNKKLFKFLQIYNDRNPISIKGN